MNKFCDTCFRDETQVVLYPVSDDGYICQACSDHEIEVYERERAEGFCSCSKHDPNCTHPNCPGYWS